MDFFSAVNDSASLSLTANDSFAQAIATSSFSTFTARLPAALPSSTLALRTTPKSTLSASNFDAVRPSELDDLSSVLFIDIRPHAAFTNARLPNALSLSVPSTLLKRPLFSLEKLATMLSSQASRARFLNWDQSLQIIVYDADSSSLPDSSNVLGLLKKFSSERPGYPGRLRWLKGGFHAVWRDRRELIDQSPVALTDNSTAAASSTLQTNLLPPSAFRAPRRSSPVPGSLRPSMPLQQPYNPFFDTVRQNVELSHGITERIPLKLCSRVKQRISELPFPWLREIASRSASTEESDVEQSMEALAMQFYRIELAEQRRLMGVMEHHSRESQLSANHDNSTVKPFPFSITAGVEKGAKNRYRHIWPFEHARVRLQQDTSQPISLTLPPVSSGPSHTFATSLSLPSSATTLGDDTDDYVNASYVQPLCTRRRYIATQGPLDATFNDFWTLVWQQNVHVIVMLTREIESSTIKCGRYWREGTYGHLRLQQMSCEGQEDTGDTLNKAASGGFFNFDNTKGTASAPSSIIKRTFSLTHLDIPHSKPRHIVHFQYLDWPDMNVPDDPRGVLGLINIVSQSMEESQLRQNALSPPCSPPHNGPLEARDFEINPRTGIAHHQNKGIQPLLLHCSAGVGRTGGYIAVDAVLDGIRHEIRKMSFSGSNDASPSPDTDVDGDVVMGGDVRTVPIPPNREGDVLHVPLVSVSPSPMGQQQQHQRATTMKWAEGVESDEGRSSIDSSSEESTFGFPSRRKENMTRDTNRELSPYGAGSDYTTASSFTSHEGLPTQPQPQKPFHLNIAGGMKISLGDEHRGRTLSAPESCNDSLAPPSSSRSLSPLVRDSEPEPEPSSPPSPVGSPPPPDADVVTPRSHPSSMVQPLGPRSATNVDYKDPRPMHIDGSPPLLSSYEEPMCEIVQDMREQRMSLCQSLRQYVFVHAAVIEGTLMVLDEEREKMGLTQEVLRHSIMSSHTSQGESTGSTSGSGSAATTMPVLSLTMNDDSVSGTSSHGKRSASPTELLKEDKKGEVRMSKRPSVKRKERSNTVMPRGGERLKRPSFEIGSHPP